MKNEIRSAEDSIVSVTREIGADYDGNECTDNFIVDLLIGGEAYSVHIKTQNGIGDLAYSAELLKNGVAVSVVENEFSIRMPEHIREFLLSKSSKCLCENQILTEELSLLPSHTLYRVGG